MQGSSHKEGNGSLGLGSDGEVASVLRGVSDAGVSVAGVRESTRLSIKAAGGSMVPVLEASKQAGLTG